MEVQWRQSITRLFAEMWKLISVSNTMRAFTLVHHNQSKFIMNLYILLKYILAVLTWQLSNITGLKSLSTIYEITKKLPYIFSFPTSSHILPEASSWRNFPSGVYLWFWSALEVGTQCTVNNLSMWPLIRPGKHPRLTFFIKCCLKKHEKRT